MQLIRDVASESLELRYKLSIIQVMRKNVELLMTHNSLWHITYMIAREYDKVKPAKR